MPVLSPSQAPNSCGQLYNPTVRGIRGIPLQYYVRPVSRQGGVFVDHPKGFQLPECIVECCNPPEEDPEV